MSSEQGSYGALSLQAFHFSLLVLQLPFGQLLLGVGAVVIKRFLHVTTANKKHREHVTTRPPRPAMKNFMHGEKMLQLP